MLSLVAHVVGYKMIVGAHNTINVRCMWEVASSSVMADVGACHTVDAQRHVGGALLCLSGMGVDDAHYTVGKMSAPTTMLGF